MDLCLQPLLTRWAHSNLPQGQDAVLASITSKAMLVSCPCGVRQSRKHSCTGREHGESLGMEPCHRLKDKGGQWHLERGCVEQGLAEAGGGKEETSGRAGSALHPLRGMFVLVTCAGPSGIISIL